MESAEIIKALKGRRGKKYDAAMKALEEIGQKIDTYKEPEKRKRQEELDAKGEAESKRTGKRVSYKDCGPTYTQMLLMSASIVGRKDLLDSDRQNAEDSVINTIKYAESLDL